MITKIVKGVNSLKFQIKGDYDGCVINALRRITIANLSTFAFSRKSIAFKTNQTIYNEDFLSMRFSLLPLNVSEFEKLEKTPDFNLDSVIAELEVSNDSKDVGEIKSVYSDDFRLYYGDDRKSLDVSKMITVPKILLLKLKQGDKISCTINVMRGTHKDNGSMFSPVSKCVHYFEPDIKGYAQKADSVNPDFTILEKEKTYLKKDDGSPTIYNYELENDGQISIEKLFPLACDYAIALIKSKQVEIKEIEKSAIISMKTSPTNMEGYDFIFENSDDTLGNWIQTTGLKYKEIKYIGYNIPHILDKKLFVRVSLGDGVLRSKYEAIMMDIMDSMIKTAQKLKKEYMDAI